jgi:hypothetical protein
MHPTASRAYPCPGTWLVSADASASLAALLSLWRVKGKHKLGELVRLQFVLHTFVNQPCSTTSPSRIRVSTRPLKDTD